MADFAVGLPVVSEVAPPAVVFQAAGFPAEDLPEDFVVVRPGVVIAEVFVAVRLVAIVVREVPVGGADSIPAVSSADWIATEMGRLTRTNNRGQPSF